MSIAERMAQLGIKLPPCPKPVAAYVPAVRVGNLVYVSGQTAHQDGRQLFVGKVGDTISVETAQEAARLSVLGCLAELAQELRDLERVERIVKLNGYVNATPDFTDHPKVINGASTLIEAIFGERGRHARAAVGVGSLPGGAPVEIELVAAVRTEDSQ